jgi:GH35 family endo-1,4-beta-xylanase
VSFSAVDDFLATKVVGKSRKGGAQVVVHTKLACISVFPLQRRLVKLAIMKATIALVLTAGTLFSAVPNLLTNPGFESGALSPWSAFSGGTMSVVGSGAYSGSVCARSTNRTSTSAGVRQSVMAVAPQGRVLVASAWVKTSSATPQTVVMRMQQTDARGTLISQFATAQIADTWVRIQGYIEYDVNGTLSLLNFFFNGPAAGVDLFVDEASLSVFDATAPENVLVNADLEAGVTSWSRHGPATVSVTASAASHTGGGALLVEGRTATWHGAEQSVLGKVEDGRLYYAAGWITTDSATAETVRLTAEVVDSSGSRFFGIAVGTASSATWTWLSGSFKMPTTSGLSDVRFFIEGPPSGVAMRVDDFYLAPLTGLRRAAVAFPALRLGAGGLGPNHFALNEKVRSAISAHFHLASPGNSLKFSNTEPADGVWTHAEANSVIELGLGRGGSSRGHAFVWHGGLPTWVSSGTFTPAQLQTILWDQIDTKGAYYRHRLPWWDVVNEAVSDSGGVLRSTLWHDAPGIGYAGGGDQYIRECFARARAADATTALYYNDYSIEEDTTKSDAVHALLSSLISSGVPVQGIGFQSHFQGATSGNRVRTNFQRFNDLNIDLHVSELDFRIPIDGNGLATTADLTTQGNDYFNYVGAVLGYSRLKVLQTWGIYDGSSWVPAAFPGYGQALLLDFNLDRKPAYWGVWNALAGQAEKLEVISNSSGDTTTIATNTGNQVSANATRRLQANAANDFMTLTFHVPFPGQWNVKLGVLKTNFSGIMQPAFAPPGSSTFTNAGGTRDNYNASNATSTYDLGTVTFNQAGDWRLRTLVTAKNGSSSDYDLLIDYIRLTPISCTPVVSALADQTIAVNGSTAARLFIAEDDTSQGSLLVTATSSNPALLPNSAITLTGSSPYYTIAATPAADQLGSSTITLNASDGTLTGSESFVLTVTGTAIQTWRMQNFGTTANASISADTADADGDGWTNAEEYTLGLTPTVTDGTALLTPGQGSGNISLTFIARTATGPGYAGLARYYDVETTTDLANHASWTTLSGYTNILATGQTITVTQPIGSQARFYRLKVQVQ